MSNLLMSTIVKRVKESVEMDMGGNRHLRPMVTLSFDDGYDSDYNIVFPIMKEFGIRGTFFIIGDEDRMTLPTNASAAQLKEMSDYSQEIGCHSHKHEPMFIEKDNEFIRNNFTESKRILEEITGRPVLTHAYPFGGGDNATGMGSVEDALRVQSIAGGVYEAARGVGTHVDTYYDGLLNLVTLYGDKNTFNVPCKLSDNLSVEQVTGMIDEFSSLEEPAWFNIAFHRIYPDDADNKPSNRYFESDFRRVVEHLHTLKTNKVIDVVPFYEGARRIRTGRSKNLV